MENKFLNIAWSLSKDLNYLDHNDLKDFELMGYDFTEKVRNSIVNNGTIGLRYFVDQYILFHEQFNIIDERIRNQVNVIRKMSYDTANDDPFDVRLQNLLKFGEIWSDTWHRLNDIKSTFGPEVLAMYEKKDDQVPKQDQDISEVKSMMKELLSIHQTGSLEIKTNKNNQTTKYITFSDLLTEKYKSKEQEIVMLLGKCFPDHYNEDGICYFPTQRNNKSILNTFMSKLKENNIFIKDYFSSENDKKVVCKIFSDKFIQGNEITKETLFYPRYSLDGKLAFQKEVNILTKELKKITSIH
jgi:hypothetical protein